jgi:HK97 family phage portal protein
MLHFAGLGFNGLTGYSPVTVARQSIGLTIGAEQFGASFYGNGAKPGGTLKIPEKLTPQAKSNIRNSINQVHQGSQAAHQLMILEEGVEFTATQIPQDDAQFIATRQFQIIEIARLFSIPPHKIGDYSESHLANVEEANLDYLTTTIAGWVRMLEAQYNWKLLSREERKQYVILHDFTALLRGNTAARATYYQTMRNMGCFSADDILRAEGLNPIGPSKGGDKYLVQMQYQPLEKAGEFKPGQVVPEPTPEPPPAPPPPPKKKRGAKNNGFARVNGDLNHV